MIIDINSFIDLLYFKLFEISHFPSGDVSACPIAIFTCHNIMISRLTPRLIVKGAGTRDKEDKEGVDISSRLTNIIDYGVWLGVPYSRD